MNETPIAAVIAVYIAVYGGFGLAALLSARYLRRRERRIGRLVFVGMVFGAACGGTTEPRTQLMTLVGSAYLGTCWSLVLTAAAAWATETGGRTIASFAVLIATFVGLAVLARIMWPPPQ